MRILLYQISILLLGLGLKLASLFHSKAQKWVEGRKDWRKKLQNHRKPQDEWLWFHCASLGEFEQGRNLLEAIKTRYPSYKILLTFFSPSGYEIRKNYPHADCVMYLPLDRKSSAQAFLDILQPKLSFFIKYELWLNYLQEMKRKDYPVILVSARVGEDSGFLKSIFALLYREAFRSFGAVFTQDVKTAELLRAFTQSDNIIESADTRYDRVRSNAEQFHPIAEIEAFKQDRLCIVVGSSWQEDESHLFEAIKALQNLNLCWIFAPHEIHPQHIQENIQQFPDISLAYSNIQSLQNQHRILWIDNIGMLSKLYAYADVAYVGGAWKTGLHNILEATVFGCPVIWGPKDQKFPEADDLKEAGGGFSIQSTQELIHLLQKLLSHTELRQEISVSNRAFVQSQAGATEQILDFVDGMI